MNPIVTIIDTFRTYQLEKADLTRLKKVKLIEGAGDVQDAVCHKICIMQAVAMVTVESDKRWPVEEADPYDESYTDHPICVSEEITLFLIRYNDYCGDRRRAKLKALIPDILNTCPIKIKEYKTKPSIEVRDRTPEYKKAETARRKLFREFGRPEDQMPPVAADKVIAVVRQAADMFRTGPGLAEELVHG